MNQPKHDWLFDLNIYCAQRGINIDEYSKDIIEDIYVEGKSVEEAYRELLTEMPENNNYEF